MNIDSLKLDEKSKLIIKFIKNIYEDLSKESELIDQIVVPLEDIAKEVFGKSNEETISETLELIKDISFKRYEKNSEDGYEGIFYFWEVSIKKYNSGEVVCIFLLSKSFQKEVLS